MDSYFDKQKRKHPHEALLLRIWWNMKVRHELTNSNETVNAERTLSLSNQLEHLNANSMAKIGPSVLHRKVILLHGNARGGLTLLRRWIETKAVSARIRQKVLPHPAHSSGLVPLDHHLFHSMQHDPHRYTLRRLRRSMKKNECSLRMNRLEKQKRVLSTRNPPFAGDRWEKVASEGKYFD